MSYNNAIPQPGDLISNSQGQILGNFAAIDSGTTGTGIGFARNHVTMTDGTNGGLHSKVDFFAPIASPTLGGTGGCAYPKNVTYTGPVTYSEVFFKNPTSDIQLTNTSLAAASGQGMLPGGLQIRCGTGSILNGFSTATVSYTTFPTAGISAVLTGFNTATAFNVSGSIGQTSFTASRTGTSGNASFYYIAIGY